MEGTEMLVYDQAAGEMFQQVKRVMQEDVLFFPVILPRSFEDFEQRISTVTRAIKKEIAELVPIELNLNLAFEKAAADKEDDSKWKCVFRDLAEVKQKKAYLNGLVTQLRDTVLKDKRETPDGTCLFPPTFPNSAEEFEKKSQETTDAITGVEKRVSCLQSGEKMLAVEVMEAATFRQGRTWIHLACELIKLIQQRALLEGRRDEMRIVATWSQIAYRENFLAKDSEDVSSCWSWSRVDLLEKQLSAPGNLLPVIHSS